MPLREAAPTLLGGSWMSSRRGSPPGSTCVGAWTLLITTGQTSLRRASAQMRPKSPGPSSNSTGPKPPAVVVGAKALDSPVRERREPERPAGADRCRSRSPCHSRSFRARGRSARRSRPSSSAEDPSICRCAAVVRIGSPARAPGARAHGGPRRAAPVARGPHDRGREKCSKAILLVLTSVIAPSSQHVLSMLLECTR